jgi:O-antigen ligase
MAFNLRRMSGALDPPRLTNHRNDLIIKPFVDSRNPDGLAFGLLYLLTILLYFNPSELIPATERFPLAGIVAIIAPLAYAYAQFKLGRSIIAWTLEVKMVFVMLSLAVLFTPIATSWADSAAALQSLFIKAALILILITGLVQTRARLRSIIRLSVICGIWPAILAIRNYATGARMAGGALEIFSDPNDLALTLNLTIPLAVTLARISARYARQFYIACALTMAAGVITTFSRSGFITLVALTALMIWKFGSGKRSRSSLAGLMAPIILIIFLSGAYHTRLRSVFDQNSGASGSGQQRSEMLKRGIDLAIRHSMIGLGMGNFHIHSVQGGANERDREKVAYNAYLEIAAELSGIGLLAYLILILAPLLGLSPIEREMRTISARKDLEARALSVGLQAALIAYIINSFFISSQYLWHLYFAAGLAVAWRRIYATERSYVTAEKFCRLDSQRSY